MTEPFVAHQHGAWCHPSADGCPSDMPASPLTDHEAAIVARFEAGEPAPESYVQQHRAEGDCFCQPVEVGHDAWQHKP